MIFSWGNKKTQGSKEQRQTRSTNEIIMKLEQDTATKAYDPRQMKETDGERQMTRR